MNFRAKRPHVNFKYEILILSMKTYQKWCTQKFCCNRRDITTICHHCRIEQQKCPVIENMRLKCLIFIFRYILLNITVLIHIHVFAWMHFLLMDVHMHTHKHIYI